MVLKFEFAYWDGHALTNAPPCVLTTLLSHFWLCAYLSLTAWPLQASGITQRCGALPSIPLLPCDSGEWHEQDGGAALQAPSSTWLLPCPVWSHARAARKQLCSDSWRLVSSRCLLSTQAVAAQRSWGPGRGGPPWAWPKGAWG